MIQGVKFILNSDEKQQQINEFSPCLKVISQPLKLSKCILGKFTRAAELIISAASADKQSPGGGVPRKPGGYFFL